MNVFDVAVYLIENYEKRMTAMKLQKLVYYSQAWSLVWEESPLFNEDIEAWIGGPVVPNLYAKHVGEFILKADSFKDFQSNEKFSDDQIETMDKIIDEYGTMNSQELSDLTHLEEPWILARAGLNRTERGNRIITHASMAEYYSALHADQ